MGLWKTDSGEVVPFIDAGGHPRLLTVRPPDPYRSALHPAYGSTGELIPASELQPFDDWTDSDPIRDQDGRGACMAFATVAALRTAFRRQYGRTPDLCEWFLYGLINGGRDAGATVESGFRTVREQGTIREGIVPYAEFRTGRFPREASEAPRYRAGLVYRITSEAEFWSAVTRRRPIAFGCAIDQSFSDLDSEGVPSSTPWGGAGGHAMKAYGGMKKSRSGRWLYRVVNSWGLPWGIKGCCWMPFDMIARGWGLDAFAVVTVGKSPDARDHFEAPPIESNSRGYLQNRSPVLRSGGPVWRSPKPIIPSGSSTA